MSEAQHEPEQRQPLLQAVETTEVYPVIHMIKTVSGGIHLSQCWMLIVNRMLRYYSIMILAREMSDTVPRGLVIAFHWYEVRFRVGSI